MSRNKGLGCCECGRTFTRSSNLYRHYRVQHDLEVVATTRGAAGESAAAVACARCPRRFSKLSNMLRHCRNVHQVNCKLDNRDSGDANEKDLGQKETKKPRECLIFTEAIVRPTVDSITVEARLNPSKGNSTPEKAHLTSTEEKDELKEITGIVDAVLRMAEELDERDLDSVLEAAAKLNEKTIRLADARTMIEYTKIVDETGLRLTKEMLDHNSGINSRLVDLEWEWDGYL